MIHQVQNHNRDFAATSVTKKTKNDDLNLKLFGQGQSETLDEELSSISYIKRFLERWKADPDFQHQVRIDSSKAIAYYNLKVDLKVIRPLWDTEFAKQNNEKEPVVHTLLKRYWQLDEKLRPQVMQSIAASSSDPQFKAWRERQIVRTASQFKDSLQDALVHSPVCFELSKGCSVGCWFCGISAPRLSDIFVYNQENAKLWREVLELMKEILGAAAGAGFCYWATDPLDNPDYEKFCSDFHEVLGTFPQTTTAQAMRDPARTRALLKLSKEKGCPLNRFSILSLKMLNQVHKEFSAEELAFVNLIPLNEESSLAKANAGRARERNIKKGKQDSNPFDQGTIACVTGFLFNMVDRSVKLISPCNADERWPLGYMVFDEGTFSNVSDLKCLLQRMIIDNMPLTIRPDDLMSFRRDLKYRSLPDGFQVSTKLKVFKFQNDPYFRELGDLIHKGNKTAEEISFLFDIRGISSSHTFHNLNLMLKRGILDEDPTPKGRN